MAKNRVIYQSEALCISRGILSSGIEDHAHLERLQSADYGFSFNKQNIAEFGEEEYLDSYQAESPTVTLDFSYYLTDGFNERALGFYVETGDGVSGNFPSGHMVASLGQNFYLLNSDEGDDIYDGTGVKSFIGFGNGFVSSYSLDASIGSAPTVSVSIEASNIISSSCEDMGGSYSALLSSVNPINGETNSATAISIPNKPRTKSDIPALRPGDISISFGLFSTSGFNSTFKIGDSDSGVHVQSLGILVPLTREAIQRCGSKFPYARAVEFPISATLYVKAFVNEIGAGNLTEMFDGGYTGDVLVDLKNKDNGLATSFLFKKVEFDQESFSASTDTYQEVEIIFETQISGPNDISRGVFMRGISSRPVFADQNGDIIWQEATMTWDEAFIKWGGG